MSRQAAASQAGIATSTLQAAEAGAAVPLSTTLHVLAGIYGVSLDSFFLHTADNGAEQVEAATPSGSS